MSTLIMILFLGFILGLRHATDADHVIAISTITAQSKSIRHSALIGILWGIGHSITVTLVGIPIILFSFVIPENIVAVFEIGVGVMLIILGILNLSGIAQKLTSISFPEAHKHQHSHGEENTHSHFHIHIPKISIKEWHHIGLFQTLRPIIIGLVHGLAGSAAIALLILTTISNKFAAIFYLFIFHIGAIVGMIMITALLGFSFSIATKKIGLFRNLLIYGSGILSIIFGVLIVVKNLK